MARVTLAKIKKACRQANWSALHATNLQYCLCIDDDGEIVIREQPQGSNTRYTKSRIYKVFCYFPYVEDMIGGVANTIGLRWVQGCYIREILDNDAKEIFEAYKRRMQNE